MEILVVFWKGWFLRIMLYLIEVDKYELNRLKAAMLHQYEHDKQYKETCLRTNNFDGADLAQDSMTRDLQLLGKLESIVIKAGDVVDDG